MPRVSVVVPTYNRAHLIGETIDSVLAQSYQDFEVIVSDDGSTDDTSAVVSEFGDRVQLVCQPHKGYGGSYARNAGIDVAQGEFVAFLDSDDLWMPDKLERQVSLLDADSEIGWAYSDSEYFDGLTGKMVFRQSTQHRLYEGDILEQLFVRHFIYSGTVIVRRQALDNVGAFWPTLKSTDRDMWLRLASRYIVGFIPDVLARFRVHPDRVTDSISGNVAFQAGISVIERAVARDPERLAPLRQQAVAELSARTGLTLARDQNLAEARMMFRQALQLNPANTRYYVYWIGSLIGGPALRSGMRLRRRLRRLRSSR